MPERQSAHQSRSHLESNLVIDVPGEGILVGASVKGEAIEADGATGTTRAAVTAAGARRTPVVKRVIRAEEGIRARAEEETRGDDPTRAFFIRIILRILWRRVLR